MHSAFNEENERVQYTISYVNKTFDKMVKNLKVISKDVEKSKQDLNSDSSQAYIDLMVSSILEGDVQLKLKNLEKAKKKPYFARIDFREIDASTEKKEKLYIGKMALLRDEDQELIIVDWRAPIANLYYEGRIGESSYNCPDGDIKGELSLKRQFGIEEGILENIFDIDITTSDEFLQSYLGANADNRLKDIVSTIQVEQNKIIRADMWKPLIIQGAAGSGKTTIALHRIAYLIYLYEKSFSPENFMIIAPSKLFLNYISETLPELGVEKVKQTTFEDFAMELIGRKFTINDSNEKLIHFVDKNITSEEKVFNYLTQKTSDFKASMFFKNVLDEYMAVIEQEFIPQADFKIRNVIILKYEDIKYLFLNQYKYLSMYKRVNEIKKHLKNRLKSKMESIKEQLQLRCDKLIAHYKQSMEETDERKRLIIEAIDQKNNAIKNAEKDARNAVNKYIASISKTDPYDYYKILLSDKNLLQKFIEAAALHGNEEKLSVDIVNFISDSSVSNFNEDVIDIEDLAPIIYLKYKIYGIDEKVLVKHIVVDEAQDFSVLQFYVMKIIVKDSSFTILGDLCQGIHSYRGTKDWNDIVTHVFGDDRCQLLTLEQSYRTTVEIMEQANIVIRNLKDNNIVPGRPVIRHGQEVSYLKQNSIQDVVKDICKKITSYKTNGYKTMAIICKTSQECVEVEKQFKNAYKSVKGMDKTLKPVIITGKEKEYKGGIVIVPSYLAKGLEFDVVFIADASNEKYKNEELDIKLLYVAMTRALHIMDVYYVNELTGLLQ